jgi:hypothetical protein
MLEPTYPSQVAKINVGLRVQEVPLVTLKAMSNTSKGKDPFLRTQQYTIQPIATGAVQAAGPEFIGYQEARMMFGLSRTHLYKLGKEGLIRTVSLRGRGTTRGRRLYSVDSIRAFLNSSVG